MKRVFLIVLDSLGIGYSKDAAKYGDYGSNTLKSVSKSSSFSIPTLLSLGLGNIDGINYLRNMTVPIASYARQEEVSKGKDTITGHYEMMGIVKDIPFPTYPNGFDDAIMNEIKLLTGYDYICNMPYSGTEVIKDYGEEHLRSGKLIIYTSADSVLQIAAHEDVIPVSELYRVCEIVRSIMVGDNEVGRIIARPFKGEYPNFVRTENRKDFALLPPYNYMDVLTDGGLDVIALGCINNIFNGKGITKKIDSNNNDETMNHLDKLVNDDFKGLCFANLEDFDMLYGHRNNALGYALALTKFDKWLSDFIPKLNDDDLLIITSDHGNDPNTPSTDHSRENTPLLIYNKSFKSSNLHTLVGFYNVGKVIVDAFKLKSDLNGESIYGEISGSK